MSPSYINQLHFYCFYFYCYSTITNLVIINISFNSNIIRDLTRRAGRYKMKILPTLWAVGMWDIFSPITLWFVTCISGSCALTLTANINEYMYIAAQISLITLNYINFNIRCGLRSLHHLSLRLI